MNKPPRPLVSIITGYHNRKDALEDSIQSVLDQTYKNFEYIIFDDCSTDGTYERLKVLEEKYEQITIIRHEHNIGFVKGIIQAVNRAKGEYIAIHGSGDYSLPTRIEKQVRVLNDHPHIGVVGCFVENDYTLTSGRKDIRMWQKIANGDARTYVLKENPFTHGEVMFRKSVYDKVGGYRDIFTFTQDFDLWCRMSMHCHFHTIEEVLYKRVLRADGASVKLDKKFLQQTLKEFAIQNHELRLQGQADLVEQYGHQSLFFFRHSKRYLRRIKPILFQAIRQKGCEGVETAAIEAFVKNLHIVSRRKGAGLLYRLLFVYPKPLALLLINRWPIRNITSKLLG